MVQATSTTPTVPGSTKPVSGFVISSHEQAYQAARAFGAFQNLAVGLTGPRLHETIPNFHNTPKRLEALQAAIGENAANRLPEVAAELEFALARAADCARITGILLTNSPAKPPLLRLKLKTP